MKGSLILLAVKINAMAHDSINLEPNLYCKASYCSICQVMVQRISILFEELFVKGPNRTMTFKNEQNIGHHSDLLKSVFILKRRVRYFVMNKLKHYLSGNTNS